MKIMKNEIYKVFAVLLFVTCVCIWVGNSRVRTEKEKVNWRVVETEVRRTSPEQLRRLGKIIEREMEERETEPPLPKKHHTSRRNEEEAPLPTTKHKHSTVEENNDETRSPHTRKHRHMKKMEDEEEEEEETPSPPVKHRKHVTMEEEQEEDETPPPKKHHKQEEDSEPHHVKDNTVKDHPGGTESEALEDRRSLSKSNWPLAKFSDAVWHGGSKPRLPKSLLNRVARSEKIQETYLKASKSCRLKHSNDERKKHAAIDIDCFQRFYWTAFQEDGEETDPECDSVYSYQSIKEYRKNELKMCDNGASELRCYRKRFKGHSVDTSICGGDNVAINFGKMPHARDYPWLDFKKGALEAQCEVPEGTKGKWNGMFIQCIADWFNKGFSPVADGPACDVTIETPTYFVTRSGDYSPFHIAHDFLNAFIAAAVHGFSFSDLQIVITDRMTKGFYLPLWQWAYTPNHKLLWYPDVREQYGKQKVCYSKAFFNVPARLSLLYNNHEHCIGKKSSVLRAFSDYVLGSFNLVGVSPPRDKLVVTVIARRNYKTGHPIGRRFGNEDELVSMLQGLHPGREVIVNEVDYAAYDFDTQMQVSRSTDLLVAMHGAGLIQMLFLPPWGSVFEFFCPEKPPSNFRYRHLAGYMGLHYDSLHIQNPQNIVPIPQAQEKLKEVTKKLLQRKNEAY
eukprot:TRINITY_DN6349_c0_g1_i1.p1 TRINITY_DN6349_c0_g1~~TRINITY_DN6349_c0_g1_i1.p1  ORF type:complete len:678 (+),score=166.16 TRINITY_DN6349_c0_g1_i1:1510-3543(+)